MSNDDIHIKERNPLKMFRLEQLVEEQKSKVSKVMPAEKDSAAKQMILWILSLEFLEFCQLNPLNFIP